MSDLRCHGCGIPLEGRQKKWCGNTACRKQASRTAWVLKVYGLTEDDYNTIWIYQNQVCAVCKRPPRTGETFHIDHVHANKGAGPVRGICCSYCNTRLIGRLKSAERARQLADYLHEPPAELALGHEVIAPGRPKKKRQPRKRKRDGT